MGYDPTKPYKERILKAIEATWKTPYVSVTQGGEKEFRYDPYPIVEHHFGGNNLFIDHTDGIGTKGVHHWRARTFKHAVADALAMNLNDIAQVRGTPFKLQNHIILQHDDHEAIIEIVGEMAKLCKSYNIAITGGETSIQNNIMGMDISMTVSSFLSLPCRRETKVGDWLLGVYSSGLHSNGFTLATELLPDNWLESLTYPTINYYNLIDSLWKKYKISGAWHIAGGGFTRLKTPGIDMRICVPYPGIPAIFHELYKATGKNDEVMYKTFNCGVGFVISAEPDVAREIIKSYDDPPIRHIGAVSEGDGRIKIVSSFGGKELCL